MAPVKGSGVPLAAPGPHFENHCSESLGLTFCPFPSSAPTSAPFHLHFSPVFSISVDVVCGLSISAWLLLTSCSSPYAHSAQHTGGFKPSSLSGGTSHPGICVPEGDLDLQFHVGLLPTESPVVQGLLVNPMFAVGRLWVSLAPRILQVGGYALWLASIWCWTNMGSPSSHPPVLQL